MSMSIGFDWVISGRDIGLGCGGASSGEGFELTHLAGALVENAVSRPTRLAPPGDAAHVWIGEVMCRGGRRQSGAKILREGRRSLHRGDGECLAPDGVRMGRDGHVLAWRTAAIGDGGVLRLCRRRWLHVRIKLPFRRRPSSSSGSRIPPDAPGSTSTIQV